MITWQHLELGNIPAANLSSLEAVGLKMVHAGNADRLVFYIRNSTDVLLQVQVIGAEIDIANNLMMATNVGSPQDVGADLGEERLISIGVNLSGGDGHRWLGLTVKAGVAPGDGAVFAWASYRENT